MAHDLVVMPQVRALSGSVPAPPDVDLSHLALLVAALADGASELRRVSRGSDVTTLIDALRQVGVDLDAAPEGGHTIVRGRALRGLVDPARPLACGRSLLTLHRLAGALVGSPFRMVLTCDVGGALPTMREIAAALRRRAAQIEGAFIMGSSAGELGPPFTVGPLPRDRALSGVEYDLAKPRPDVKQALLFSGLYAEEATYVREAIVSRDHLERMLAALDAPVQAAGSMVALETSAFGGRIEPFFFEVPGDAAFAALLAGLAALIPASRVCVRGVGLNPTRTGAFDVLRMMGADIEATAQATRLGETEGTVCAGHAPLRAVSISGELLLHAADDVPVLLALAARARGITEVTGIDDVGRTSSVEERPFSAQAMVELLRAFGVDAESREHSTVVVSGRPDGPLEGADIDADGDPARATTALMLGFLGNRPTRIRRVDALAERFPRVVGTLRALGAEMQVESHD